MTAWLTPGLHEKSLIGCPEADRWIHRHRQRNLDFLVLNTDAAALNPTLFVWVQTQQFHRISKILNIVAKLST